MDKLLDENDSDLEIVFDDEEQSEILQFQQKANWADSEFEIISGITIEANYLDNGSSVHSPISPAFLDPLLELGVAKECQKKNKIVAPPTNILVNPVSPDSTETNSARDIHHMLTRQEATQSRFAHPEITEIANDGQSEENYPNIYYNHHNNTGDAELMPTLERVVDYPPQLKSQQMICDSSLRDSPPKLEFHRPVAVPNSIVIQTAEQKTRGKAHVLCPHCSKAYTRRENLRRHIKREHSVCNIHEGVQACQRCSECLACCGGQCLEERTFTCNICACEVPNAEMRQHLLVQPCQTCGVHFPCTTAYTSHWQNGQCLMPTINKEMYPNLYGESSAENTHAYWNQSGETEPCKAFGFYVPNEAVSVDVEPSVQKEFPCQLCGRVFLNKQSIPLHMSTMHATAIYCRRCCRTFDTYEQLLVHDNLKACTAIEGPDRIGDFSPINDGYVEPSSTSNTQIEPQCAPKKVRRSSSTANVFCPFCPKIYCRRDKMIEHIKKNHLGKCWFCFCDMGLVEHDGFVCPLCRQQFCCLKLSKYHKCTVCMHCKLKVPAFERKLHASKRSCSSCEKIFLCATASNNHNCPRAGPSQ